MRKGAGHDGDKWRGAAGMPCTLPLSVGSVDDARRAAARDQNAAGMVALCPAGVSKPTLIISTQGG